ncbi:MAG: SCO1664 family protein [Actinomycetota bacterium]
MSNTGDGSPYEYHSTLPCDDPAVPDVLGVGSIELLGRMPWSSNATFLVEVTHDGEIVPAVYKPARGERPLWDFPEGLWQREVAAYELSDRLGWDLVPPTVARLDGPVGPGSLQVLVPARYDEHYFTIRDRPDHEATLQRLCAFDVVANSTDRKGGHILLDEQDRIWAIDNGLTFHSEFKLRTVIWEYAGEPIDAEILRPIEHLANGDVGDELSALLAPDELEALSDRAVALVAHGCFPTDPTGRRHPWPMV